jgi:hypothetical protein
MLTSCQPLFNLFPRHQNWTFRVLSFNSPQTSGMLYPTAHAGPSLHTFASPLVRIPIEGPHHVLTECHWSPDPDLKHNLWLTLDIIDHCLIYCSVFGSGLPVPFLCIPLPSFFMLPSSSNDGG